MGFQKSSGTARERWVSAMLPAAVIVMCYLMFNYWWISGLNKKIAADQKPADAAVSEDVLASIHAQKLAAIRERDQLQDQLESAQAQIDKSLAPFVAGDATTRMMRVDEICRKLSISLLLQKPTTDLKLSNIRELELRRLQQLAPKNAITYRQLELAGTYVNIQQLLQQLATSVEGVAPLKIELLSSSGSANMPELAPGERLWRVIVLM